LSLQGVVSPSLLIHGGVVLDHVSGHTREHTKPHESGVSDSGRVPEDLVSSAPMRGYVLACTAFYEREFGVPSH
jgi:hypothetical protein